MSNKKLQTNLRVLNTIRTFSSDEKYFFTSYEHKKLQEITKMWRFYIPLYFVKGNLASGRQPKKLSETHVSAQINRQSYYEIMPLLSKCSSGPKEHVKYP